MKTAALDQQSDSEQDQSFFWNSSKARPTSFLPRGSIEARTSDAPSIARSDVFCLDDESETDTDNNLAFNDAPNTRPLQWVFTGLTLWAEYEEFNNDLTKAIDHASRIYGTSRVPSAHSTLIYGMTHLSANDAMEKLNKIPSVLPSWPSKLQPTGIQQGVARKGQRGQVCDIAWAEISLETNPQHEHALDLLAELFEVSRERPWTPHISLAYDNPDQTVLSLKDTYQYVRQHPTLMQARQINAISLWNTDGPIAEWSCLGRVKLE